MADVPAFISNAMTRQQFLHRVLTSGEVTRIGQHLALVICLVSENGVIYRATIRELADLTGWGKSTIFDHLSELEVFMRVTLGVGRCKTEFELQGVISDALGGSLVSASRTQAAPASVRQPDTTACVRVVGTNISLSVRQPDTTPDTTANVHQPDTTEMHSFRHPDTTADTKPVFTGRTLREVLAAANAPRADIATRTRADTTPARADTPAQVDNNITITKDNTNTSTVVENKKDMLNQREKSRYNSHADVLDLFAGTDSASAPPEPQADAPATSSPAASIPVPEEPTPDSAPGRAAPLRRAKPTTEQFDRFWAVYPQRKGKAKAFERFQALTPEEAEQAIFGATRYAQECTAKRTDEKYIKWPEGWLNSRRFVDYVDQGQDSSELSPDWWRDCPDTVRELPEAFWRKIITLHANGTWPVDKLGPGPWEGEACLVPEGLRRELGLAAKYPAGGGVPRAALRGGGVTKTHKSAAQLDAEAAGGQRALKPKRALAVKSGTPGGLLASISVSWGKYRTQQRCEGARGGATRSVAPSDVSDCVVPDDRELNRVVHTRRRGAPRAASA